MAYKRKTVEISSNPTECITAEKSKNSTSKFIRNKRGQYISINNICTLFFKKNLNELYSIMASLTNGDIVELSYCDTEEIAEKELVTLIDLINL